MKRIHIPPPDTAPPSASDWFLGLAFLAFAGVGIYAVGIASLMGAVT